MIIHNLGRPLIRKAIGALSLLVFVKCMFADGTLPALREAYSGCFLLGVAVNRPTVNGSGGIADNVNRTTIRFRRISI